MYIAVYMQTYVSFMIYHVSCLMCMYAYVSVYVHECNACNMCNACNACNACNLSNACNTCNAFIVHGPKTKLQFSWGKLKSTRNCFGGGLLGLPALTP